MGCRIRLCFGGCIFAGVSDVFRDFSVSLFHPYGFGGQGSYWPVALRMLLAMIARVYCVSLRSCPPPPPPLV